MFNEPVSLFTIIIIILVPLCVLVHYLITVINDATAESNSHKKKVKIKKDNSSSLYTEETRASWEHGFNS